MDTVNSNPNETQAVPESVPAPVASTPEAVPVVQVAPVVTAATPSVPAVKGELPKTSGNTVGGWNRFAGYNPNAAKDKKNDRRDNKGRR